MEPLQQIHNLDHLKILADSRRLAILRLLMAAPYTLSQLGVLLGEHPAQVRHHLKLLEGAGLVEMVSTRVVRGFVEKYYRARTRAVLFHKLILPAAGEQEQVVALASHDLALELLEQHFHQEGLALELLVLPVGSLDGLVALRQGAAQIAGCHLLDVESGEYNLPYLQHIFPDRRVAAITLAHRQQGLLLAAGNPRQVRGLDDLVRPTVALANRNRGSGTRLWLDRQLERRGIPVKAIRGYQRELRTHTAVAEAIQQGSADVGLGLEAAAHQAGLDFIPLFQERYDLVIPQELLENRRIQALFDYLNSAKFRRLVESLSGYEAKHTGEKLTD